MRPAAQATQPRTLSEANWPLRAGLVAVALWIGVALLAPLLAPFDPAETVDPVESSWRPPWTRLLEVRSEELERPRLAEELRLDDGELVLERRGGELRLGAEGADDAQVVARFHLLGTDRLGRDVLSRLLWGSRTTLWVGFAATAFALILGLSAGAAAGLGPRWLDSLVMRTVDGFLSFPTLVLILLLAALFRPNSFWLALLIGGLSWMTIARITRSELQRRRNSLQITAARAMGLHPGRVFVRHQLPAIQSPLWVDAGLRVGASVLAESALSFLGFGVSAPQTSWGLMIAHAQLDLERGWWMLVFPGLCLTLCVLSFTLLGEGLHQRSLARPKG